MSVDVGIIACDVGLYIERGYNHAGVIMERCRASPCVLVGGHVDTLRCSDGDVATLRSELKTFQNRLLCQALSFITCPESDGVRLYGKLAVEIDIIGKDTLLLHQLLRTSVRR